MPQEVFLECYNNDFSEEIPITLEEWKHVADVIEGIRYEEDGSSLDVFFEEYNGWQPIFWFSTSTHIHMNARAVSFLWYEFAVKIAEYFKAIIIGEAGEIIYLPTYGGIYDSSDAEFGTIETWNLKLEQIIKNKILFDENFKTNIDKIIEKPLSEFAIYKETELSDKEREELMKAFYSTESSKKWWQFWK